MAFDDDGAIVRPSTSTSCPTAAPTRRRGRSMTAAAVGMLFPGPYRVPARRLRRPSRLHEHRRAAPPTAGRGSSRRSPARCCSTSRRAQMGIDPVELRRRNLLRRDELPVHQPQRHDLRQHLAARDASSRRSRCSTTRRSGPSRPQARAEGRYLGVGLSNYVEPSTPGYGVLRAPRRATIRIEPSGKVNVYIAGGSTGNSLETTVVQLTADALGVRHRRRRHDPGRHRGHRRSAPAPPAAAAGR